MFGFKKERLKEKKETKEELEHKQGNPNKSKQTRKECKMYNTRENKEYRISVQSNKTLSYSIT